MAGLQTKCRGDGIAVAVSKEKGRHKKDPGDKGSPLEKTQVTTDKSQGTLERKV